MKKELTQKNIVIISELQKDSSSDSDIIEPVDYHFGKDKIMKQNEKEPR